jgi:hypothetical protein
VLSNLAKEHGSDVEVVVGLPSKNTPSLPFGHDVFSFSFILRMISWSRATQYRSFPPSYLSAPSNEVVGFFRWAEYPNGTRFYPDVHGAYHWVPDSVKRAREHVFARFTNEHSGSYALTRAQLANFQADF